MKHIIFFFALVSTAVLHSQNRPKLVVAIVIDQMRYEMLDRFSSDFGENGFNLIGREGLRYDSCYFEYVPTYTGPGHATIFTGELPSQHGIVGNDMYLRSTGQSVYCVEDASAEPVGSTDSDCARSPRLLKSGSLGDILKKTHPESKTITLSIKDRGAILAGGKMPNGVYWMDTHGKMVSSTHYTQMLPAWVNEFNQEDLVGDYMVDEWKLLHSADHYNESLPDDAAFESQLLGEGNSFPYDLSVLLEKEGPKGIAYTPFGNTVLTEFALEALAEEDLGQDESTDLLAIMYSSTDYIGHAFGPQSVEIQDTYLRLDLELGKLIKALDKRVGRQDYILFISSDHGAANTPADSSFQYVQTSELKKEINTITSSVYGLNLVKHISNSQVWLDDNLIKENGLDKDAVVAELCNYLPNQTDVELSAVYSAFQVENCVSTGCMPFKHAFDPDLSGDLFYTRPYGHMERGASYGTTHGSSYEYDTHVPLLFLGGKVSAGRIGDRVGTHQIIGELQNFFW